MPKQKIPRELYWPKLSDFVKPLLGGRDYALGNSIVPENPKLERRRDIRASHIVIHHRIFFQEFFSAQ